ncbi:PI-PLC X domain-containing protein 1 isoform X2 [Petaurus breviceps papuanus]|uniref:PI-PLC X domain-containing protein 1 isoform X2 n=1 Tax=Petaurus breviceps papuanus TaxID=3040969 RepID=UPI0036DE9496
MNSTNAQWMSELPPRLWDIPLHHLSIPGSHDTMTYCLNKKSPVSQNESKLLQVLNKVVPCITRPVILKWSTTQDTLTDISEWLQNHPKEVVILACRNFEGMTAELHQYLVTCIKNIFGKTLCPRGELLTLKHLWRHGYRVIVSYEDEITMHRHKELWPGIPYWWGNKVKRDDLICYLESMKESGRPDELFVAGINLTENFPYIMAHPSGSLKKMTLPNLPYLNAWVQKQCPGPGTKCTNIIAGDFVGSDSFVSDVIALNQKLLID